MAELVEFHGWLGDDKGFFIRVNPEIYDEDETYRDEVKNVLVQHGFDPGKHAYASFSSVDDIIVILLENHEKLEIVRGNHYHNNNALVVMHSGHNDYYTIMKWSRDY